MSLLLYVVGALAAVGGAAAILFGIPVKEFSFGDTLIVSGTVALVGGLIVVGLAAAVSQLQRLAEMVGARPLSRSGRPVDVLEAARGSRTPFPPKPKPESGRSPAELPPFVAAPPEEPATPEEEFAAPSIRNPDLPLPAEEPAEEAPVVKPAAARPSPFRFPERPKAPLPPPQAEPPPRAAPSFESSLPEWRKPAPAPVEPPRTEPAPPYFDAMWKNEPRTPPAAPPAEAEPPRTRVAEPFKWPEPEPPVRAKPAEAEPARELAEPVQEAEEPLRAVAVLKSGVVDGMGYTLYVDGSIEAELPDGTLRFASINELRAHLEKTG
jgi:hypothetical protein